MTWKFLSTLVLASEDTQNQSLSTIVLLSQQINIDVSQKFQALIEIVNIYTQNVVEIIEICVYC